MPHNLGYPKEVEVTQEGIRELIATWGPRYRRANRKGKTSILDEFAEVGVYHRFCEGTAEEDRGSMGLRWGCGPWGRKRAARL